MEAWEFVCPQCDGDRLAAVDKNGDVHYLTLGLNEDAPEFDFSGNVVKDVDIEFYECPECGFRLPSANWEDVIKWVKDSYDRTDGKDKNTITTESHKP
jgi:transcription initiation factor IIE alpha subunit